MHLKHRIHDFLSERSIGIAGLGLEGRSTLAWLERQGISGNVCVARDESAFAALREADYIFRSPGIHPSKLKPYLKQGAEIVSQTSLCLRYSEVPVIAVTGTKGKSTTASMLHHLLKESGTPALFSGNIGIPHFDVSDTDPHAQFWVMELSAQQLMDVQHGPEIALWLNFFPEHLDYFGSSEAYGAAKAKIFGPGTIRAVAGSEVPERWISGVPLSASIYRFEPEGNADFPFAGPNYAALSLVWKILGKPEEAIAKHLVRFKPLPYRLELVAEIGGVRFFDDALATIPQASLHGVRSLGGVRFLILGGKDRGVDPGPMLRVLTQEFPDTVLLLIGEMGNRLASMLHSIAAQGDHVLCETLPSAVAYVGKHGKKGDRCLFSPAAASHDAYPDYRARSAHYRQLIQGLSQ
jgi:UDP-N-acetylmuramoyl-L-alanine---L-glutamate ligase